MKVRRRNWHQFSSENEIFWQWTGSNVTRYDPVSETGGAEGQQQRLFTSVLGLRLKVGSNHFMKGAIRIKCVASILGQQWETKKTITHQNYHPPLSSYSSGEFSPRHILTFLSTAKP
jgi:hypothetical protein